MYESRKQPPLPRRRFARRLVSHGLAAATFALVSLLAGMAGYAHYEHLAWRDAFLNAAMILGGMGPVDAPHTDGGKVFAGLYALFAGFVVLVSVALLLAPFVHRLLHKFHWPDEH